MKAAEGLCDEHSTGRCSGGGKKHARDLCKRHYRVATRFTKEEHAERARVRALTPPVDDGVRSPGDLPVIAKAVSPLLNRRGVPRTEWAVMMPYPSLDGTHKCDGREDLFTADDGDVRFGQDVLEMCASCPFLTPCQEWALAHEEYGYWGGMGPHQRRERRRARGQMLVTPHLAYAAGFPGRDWSVYAMAGDFRGAPGGDPSKRDAPVAEPVDEWDTEEGDWWDAI
jgi:hypothetical protein